MHKHQDPASDYHRYKHAATPFNGSWCCLFGPRSCCPRPPALLTPRPDQPQRGAPSSSSAASKSPRSSTGSMLSACGCVWDVWGILYRSDRPPIHPCMHIYICTGGRPRPRVGARRREHARGLGGCACCRPFGRGRGRRSGDGGLRGRGAGCCERDRRRTAAGMCLCKWCPMFNLNGCRLPPSRGHDRTTLINQSHTASGSSIPPPPRRPLAGRGPGRPRRPRPATAASSAKQQQEAATTNGPTPGRAGAAGPCRLSTGAATTTIGPISAG